MPRGALMESGEFFENASGRDAHQPGRGSLWVRRKAYRRFDRWMDKQLADLVARWGHLATPGAQRVFRPTRPRSKT